MYVYIWSACLNDVVRGVGDVSVIYDDDDDRYHCRDVVASSPAAHPSCSPTPSLDHGDGELSAGLDGSRTGRMMQKQVRNLKK